MHSEIHDLETEMIALQESADLFEVIVPDYKQLKVGLFCTIGVIGAKIFTFSSPN